MNHRNLYNRILQLPHIFLDSRHLLLDLPEFLIIKKDCFSNIIQSKSNHIHLYNMSEILILYKIANSVTQKSEKGDNVDFFSQFQKPNLNSSNHKRQNVCINTTLKFRTFSNHIAIGLISSTTNCWDNNYCLSSDNPSKNADRPITFN